MEGTILKEIWNNGIIKKCYLFIFFVHVQVVHVLYTSNYAPLDLDTTATQDLKSGLYFKCTVHATMVHAYINNCHTELPRYHMYKVE